MRVYDGGTLAVSAAEARAAVPIEEVRVAGVEPNGEDEPGGEAPPALLARAAGTTWVAFADGSGAAVSGGAQGFAGDWDPVPGRTPRALFPSPDGTRLAVLTHDDRLALFDTGTGERVAATSGVTAAAFTADGAVLAGTGPDALSKLGPGDAGGGGDLRPPRPAGSRGGSAGCSRRCTSCCRTRRGWAR